MDFLECLYKYMSKQTNLTSIVGTNIFPLFIPQYDKIPAVTYYPVSNVYDTEFGNDTNFIKSIIQFDCHDKTFKKARTLSRIVKNIFQDFHGDMEGTEIQATFIRSDLVMNDSSSNKFDADDTVHIIEIEFYYNEN